ncbi:MAG: uracil phosphoribosyltransferase [Candidatus Marinimicrobia bacterium]|nr:uracil phosphoribosyltransferase [Candidatus Neomarinimicrobiota bacterium]MBT3631219.1 uracil phosphoribosyltransferase [Candidatus Neomarinimicrobiota bacterium]MBT3824727.1 uracil phosphoribosyltransferase [Candidatus Neomarinimicrobiota bacterium]MBT4131651.1 uracil phosphoribosyltransferase [Candidatus Neomarinimicrobiota bacterium]MBT4296120.1 uracil phosphoribosyltransferase [Candidatus Neomarinimicrobiota bacterium]
MSQVIELKSHPLVSHNLAILRSKDTDSQRFREAAQRLTTMVLVAATESLNTVEQTVETPMQKTTEMVLAEDVWFIPVLRAGLAMVDVGLNLLPDAHVGFVGLYRDEESLEPQHYYKNLPDYSKSAHSCFLMDPMLATGGSACAAIDLLKAQSATEIRLLTLICAPEGIKEVFTKHPDVSIFTASVDERLNDIGYIIPGLGDAGDRYFGT